MSRRSADIFVRQIVRKELADELSALPRLRLQRTKQLIMLLSIGDQVKPGTYRFHSRFNRVVNFEHRGRLIAVVDETIGPGPLNIVLRALAQARAHAAPPPSILKGLHPSAQGWIAGARRGDPTLGEHPIKILNPEGVEAPTSFAPLQITPRTVLFAGQGYHFTSRNRYDSTLDFEVVDSDRFRRNLTPLGESLKKAAPPKSLAFLLDSKRRRNFRGGFERAFAEQITHGVHQVLHGRRLQGIRLLKGSGLGLTPAGDDFIAGFLIGWHILQKMRGQDSQPVANAVFRAARGKNVFSNTFLDLARRGFLFGRMKDLLRALTSDDADAVRKAAEWLFALGETSGADFATGFFMTVRNQTCAESGLRD